MRTKVRFIEELTLKGKTYPKGTEGLIESYNPYDDQDYAILIVEKGYI